MFERIKNFYERKLYNIRHVAAFVATGVITSEQYKDITGEDYVV